MKAWQQFFGTTGTVGTGLGGNVTSQQGRDPHPHSSSFSGSFSSSKSKMVCSPMVSEPAAGASAGWSAWEMKSRFASCIACASVTNRANSSSVSQLTCFSCRLPEVSSALKVERRLFCPHDASSLEVHEREVECGLDVLPSHDALSQALAGSICHH